MYWYMHAIPFFNPGNSLVCVNSRVFSQAPPLHELSKEEIVEHLWSGEKSVARRAVRVRSCSNVDCGQ